MNLGILDEYTRCLTPKQVKMLVEKCEGTLNSNQDVNSDENTDNSEDFSKYEKTVWMEATAVQMYTGRELIDFIMQLQTASDSNKENLGSLSDLECEYSDKSIVFKCLTQDDYRTLVAYLIKFGIPDDYIKKHSF